MLWLVESFDISPKCKAKRLKAETYAKHRDNLFVSQSPKFFHQTNILVAFSPTRSWPSNDAIEALQIVGKC